jgi:hypothetical protein
MASKNEGNSCYDNAAPDEPLFVLKATDPLAPRVVEEWARIAQENGVNQAKIDDARQLAERMRQYHEKKLPD